MLVVLFLVLGALAGAALGFLKPATYSSSTTVLANQIAGNPYTPDSNSDTLEMLQTEAVAVTSQDVLKRVVDNLGIDITPERLRQQSFVTVPPNTQALQITYTSAEPQLSAQLADAIAAQYLAQRQAQALSAIQEQVTNLTSQLDNARIALQQANKTNDPNASAIRALIIDIQGRISTANAQTTDPGRVLTPGSLPKDSRTRHLLVFTIAGLLVGGLVGLLAAMFRERRKDAIRSVDDLSDYEFEAPVTTIHGTELDNDSLRHLRMRLSPQIKGHGVVGLVGLAPGHAISMGVLLGNSLVAGGTSVALIDGTGTEPGHRDVMGLDTKPGLAQALLTGQVPTAYAVEEDFGYLPAGEDAHLASEHLLDEQARTIVHGVAQAYDFTLIACMPLDNAEGEALAQLAEGVILLVQPGTTSHFELGMALRALKSQRLRLIGVFVLPPSR